MRSTQWPATGVPANAGAWLTAVAKRRAIDGWRRRERLDERYRAMARDLAESRHRRRMAADRRRRLRLVFISCHPVLSREAQVALTLRIVARPHDRGDRAAAPRARSRPCSSASCAPRRPSPRRTCRSRRPSRASGRSRLGAVLGVVYLVFTEGYAATSGDHWIRPEVANEALRLGRVLAGLLPREPEAHGLVALMELQASRFAARVAPDGSPILLDRAGSIALGPRADRAGSCRPRRVRSVGRGRGSVRACRRRSPNATRSRRASRRRIGNGSSLLYEALGRIAPSPVIELNRAVAVSMATGPPTRCASSTGSRPRARCADRTCCRACAASCSPGSVASRRRGPS